MVQHPAHARILASSSAQGKLEGRGKGRRDVQPRGDRGKRSGARKGDRTNRQTGPRVPGPAGRNRRDYGGQGTK